MKTGREMVPICESPTHGAAACSRNTSQFDASPDVSHDVFIFHHILLPRLRDAVKGIGHIRVSGVAEPFQRGVYSRESSSDCLNLSDGVSRLCFKLTCAYLEQSSVCCSMRSPPPKKKNAGA